jgi:hypothetical protein
MNNLPVIEYGKSIRLVNPAPCKGGERNEDKNIED